jgi:hypothetical protein
MNIVVHRADVTFRLTSNLDLNPVWQRHVVHR